LDSDISIHLRAKIISIFLLILHLAALCAPWVASAASRRAESLYYSLVNLRSTHSEGEILYGLLPPSGSCTGFILDGEGHVVTQYRCLIDRYEIVATLHDGTSWPARYIGHDDDTGVAVLKIRAPKRILSKLKPVILGYGPEIKPGTRIRALGSPIGGWYIMKEGIVAARPRTIKVDGAILEELLYTTIPFSPLLNGAPIADGSGRVVGMVLTPPPQAQGQMAGFGLAINAEVLQSVAIRLITRGAAPRPWIGAHFMDITPTLASMFNLPVKNGVMVVNTDTGGPAFRSGLKGSNREITVGNIRYPLGGDIIIWADGTKVNRLADLMEILRAKNPGDTISLKVLRKGKRKKVTIKLGKMPPRSY